MVWRERDEESGEKREVVRGGERERGRERGTDGRKKLYGERGNEIGRDGERG